MVAYLVGEDVRLREVASSLEPAVERLVEPEVDVHALVGGTVERSHRRLSNTAPGLHDVPEEHEPGVTVLLSMTRQDRRPDGLRVVQHEVDELDEPCFFRALGHWRDGSVRRRRDRPGRAGAVEQVLSEKEAEDEEYEATAKPHAFSANAGSLA